MASYLLALHVTATSLVVGSLFLQSLMVVMALRLPNEQQREGTRTLMGRVHLFIYYPILGVAVLSGLWLAMSTGAFESGRWLHWKLLLVVLLAGLGFLTGGRIRAQQVAKGPAMVIHILIFLVSILIIYLATARPF